jgi:DNA-binding IclR family transcriptional regulator
MSRLPLPDDVRRFVLTSVPSVPYIESLLLMRREADAAWSASRLASRIYVPEAQAAGLLETLEASGIAARVPEAQGTFRYQPPQPLAELLDRVAVHYASNLLAVTDLIHSSLNRRANQFADAFRWRKDS